MDQIAHQAPTWVDTANVLVSIADVIATTIVGIVVGILAYSHERQRAMQVAEKRLAAYQALWRRMKAASPYRQTVWNPQPLTQEERLQLFKDFTDWYYEDGNGMYMGGDTRAIYLMAKDNLVRELRYYKPESIRGRLKELGKLAPEKQEQARGYLSIRQLSLLRNSMKAELNVFGIPYHISLEDWDIEFLEACGIRINKKPWSESRSDPVRTEQEVEIFPRGSVQSRTDS